MKTTISILHHVCRFFTEMAMYALDVLGVVTLMPGTRRGVLGTRVRRQRLGISTLLGAAAGSNFLGNSEVGFKRVVHMPL
jgi:hypothetical protein